MTLDQLRIFVEVAERQHVTRAAEALGIAQSAASHAIAALEERYRTPLFHRIGRRIELTEAGRMLLGEARAILGQVDHAEQALTEFDSLSRGTLRVAASQTIAGYWLPARLAAFRRAHPAIALRMTIGNTAQVAEAVLSGAAELGFVEDAVTDPRLSAHAVAADRLVVVVAPDHPWAGEGALDPARLAESAWVRREPGSGTRSAFEHATAGLGIDGTRLPVAMELPSNEAVRAAAEAGMGAAVLSASVVAPSLEAGLLHHVPFALPERVFEVLHLGRSRPTRAATALLGQLGIALPEG
ncbi:LysR substrate-binding domain-containing protein [Acidimangrovimonas sediminis]|uniref:LysR substrate-binding domain-containing protein n=1 Tax=Acidimangrovimonas sediminis TaxID=2056283 RepID=UPI000C7FDE8B|nr:LysR substrate-binding domain-containing protein [Acidimangrovimonas sediminis]